MTPDVAAGWDPASRVCLLLGDRGEHSKVLAAAVCSGRAGRRGWRCAPALAEGLRRSARGWKRHPQRHQGLRSKTGTDLTHTHPSVCLPHCPQKVRPLKINGTATTRPPPLCQRCPVVFSRGTTMWCGGNQWAGGVRGFGRGRLNSQ